MTEKIKKKPGVIGLMLILLIAVVAALAVFTIMGRNAPIAGGAPGFPGAKGAEEEMVYTVLARELAPLTMENYLKFNGDVIAETSVDLYPDTSGELTALYVSLGSYVRKNQVIAKVDPSVPGQVYVASPVKSTITGTVTDLPFDVGDTISSAQVPVATVGDLTELQVECYISEKYMADVALGQKASISFEPFEGERFAGTVSEISPVLDTSSRTLEIKITLDDRDDKIKSGMFASVKLITEEKEAVLAVPSESIISSSEGDFVYLVGNGNVAEKRFIDTGLSIDGLTEVSGGLSSGDSLVVRGQSMLKDGSALRVAE
jgi:multidrug efflux pump subunit AcrA (membrane-fusion protein)